LRTQQFYTNFGTHCRSSIFVIYADSILLQGQRGQDCNIALPVASRPYFNRYS